MGQIYENIDAAGLIIPRWLIIWACVEKYDRYVTDDFKTILWDLSRGKLECRIVEKVEEDY